MQFFALSGGSWIPMTTSAQVDAQVHSEVNLRLVRQLFGVGRVERGARPWRRFPIRSVTRHHTRKQKLIFQTEHNSDKSLVFTHTFLPHASKQSESSPNLPSTCPESCPPSSSNQTPILIIVSDHPSNLPAISSHHLLDPLLPHSVQFPLRSFHVVS